LKNNTVHGINKPWIEKTSFEKFFNIEKGQPFVWQCHDCHERAVIPGTYINIRGETVKIDPQNLDPNTEGMRF